MSTLPLLSDNLFWAKLGSETVHPRLWHPLVAHSADVAAVMERLLQEDSVLGSRVARLSGGRRLSDDLRALLVFLTALHDLGKTNHGFQERRHSRPRFPHEDHVQVVLSSMRSSALLNTLSEVLAPALPPQANPETLLAATIAHHGRPFSTSNRPNLGGGLARLWAPDQVSGRDPLAEIRRLGKLAEAWSGIRDLGPPPSIPEDPRLTHLFAGLVTLADWIGSTEAAFKFAPSADSNPDGYWLEARQRADWACREIGVVAWRRAHTGPSGDLYTRLFPRVFGAETGAAQTELQTLASELPLAESGGRILVEAATGSGKTEAALVLYARMRAAGVVGGLMFALPTRATARAMYERVQAALPGIYGDDPPGVTLAVGGEDPQAMAAPGVLTAKAQQWDEESGEKALSLTAWASTHAKKYLAAEIVVGTIDQALLAALVIKHAHLRLAGLARHLLVVDEVHSHDRYTLDVLRTLLDFHAGAGGTAVLMSATLSAEARGRLGGAPDGSSFAEATGRPFPTLATLGPDGNWVDNAVDTEALSRKVRWRLEQEDTALTAALNAARAGARVCVLRNLVKGAQQTVEKLVALGARELLWRPSGSELTPPYHARYARADRSVLDREVMASFGKEARGAGGCILVATQVVEQSLDLDFDLLVTDLAPIEVLIQRIGRLHRHRSRDPARPVGFQEPLAVIAGPAGPYAPRKEWRGPHGWGTVYQNLPALELTRRLLATRASIRLPGMSRTLLEEVYHADRLDDLRAEQDWDPVVCELEGRSMTHDGLARDAVLHFHEPYDENAARYRDEGKIRTRLGDDTIRIALDPPAPCWFAPGEHAAFVDLSLERVAGATDLDLRNPRLSSGQVAEDGVAEYPLGGRRLRYERSGWTVVAASGRADRRN